MYAIRSYYVICFAAFGVLAYVTLMVLGTEAFLVSSFTWVLGALLGNLAGFEVTTRLRMSNTRPISIA